MQGVNGNAMPGGSEHPQEVLPAGGLVWSISSLLIKSHQDEIFLFHSCIPPAPSYHRGTPAPALHGPYTHIPIAGRSTISKVTDIPTPLLPHSLLSGEATHSCGNAFQGYMMRKLQFSHNTTKQIPPSRPETHPWKPH